MKSTVSIVIVTWNSRRYIEKYFECLSKQTYTNYEIIVVDNVSLDGTIDYLNQNHSHLVIVKNQKKSWLCKTGNQGIKASEGEFILMLNPDVFPEPDFLEELVLCLAIVSMVQQEANSYFLRSRTIDSTGLFLTRSLKAQDRGNFKEDCGQYDQDEEFFAYYEDLDLCWRMQLMGFECGYNPKAIAYHVRGGSGFQPKFFKKTPFFKGLPCETVTSCS